MSKFYKKNGAALIVFNEDGVILQKKTLDVHFCVGENLKKDRTIEISLPDVVEGMIFASLDIQPILLRKLLDAGAKEYAKK